MPGVAARCFDPDRRLAAARADGVRRNQGLEGDQSPIMHAAMLCFALNLLAVVADHGDARNNETNCNLISRVTWTAGLCLVVLAILLHAGKP
jgi:hypothetical protein